MHSRGFKTDPQRKEMGEHTEIAPLVSLFFGHFYINRLILLKIFFNIAGIIVSSTLTLPQDNVYMYEQRAAAACNSHYLLMGTPCSELGNLKCAYFVGYTLDAHPGC